MRSKDEPGAKTKLIIVKTKWLEGAVIFPVQIIAADGPKSSDRKIERRFDEIVIVPPTRGHAVHGAEIIRVLVSARYAEIKSL